MTKTFLDFEGLTTYNDKIKGNYLSKDNMEMELADYVKTDSLTETLGEYATQESISDMLTKTEASSVYVDNDKLTSQLESQKTELQQEINEKISTVYKPQGSTSFESLTRPPTEDMVGYVYNMNDQFTTDTYFLEGVGHNYSNGTNVVVVNDLGEYKYDVFSGIIDLSDYIKESDITSISNEQIASLFVGE